MSDDKINQLLHKVPASRRAVIKAMITGTAFIVPMVASFPMDGRIGVSRAMADYLNDS